MHDLKTILVLVVGLGCVALAAGLAAGRVRGIIRDKSHSSRAVADLNVESAVRRPAADQIAFQLSDRPRLSDETSAMFVDVHAQFKQQGIAIGELDLHRTKQLVVAGRVPLRLTAVATTVGWVCYGIDQVGATCVHTLDEGIARLLIKREQAGETVVFIVGLARDDVRRVDVLANGERDPAELREGLFAYVRRSTDQTVPDALEVVYEGGQSRKVALAV